MLLTGVGAVAGVLALRPSDDNDPAVSTGDITAGACAQVGNNNTCTIQQEADAAGKAAKDAEDLKNIVARGATSPPQLPGPWPYLIYNTVISGNDVGLKVKSTAEPSADQIGSTPSRSIVWAECILTNNYNPEVGSDVDVGPRWLRIFWPTNVKNSGYATSSPSDKYRAYVYSGYALSFQHNGDIPVC